MIPARLALPAWHSPSRENPDPGVRSSFLLSSPEGRQSGLLSDPVIMTDNIATIALSEIDRVIGRLPMARVDEAIRHTLGL